MLEHIYDKPLNVDLPDSSSFDENYPLQFSVTDMFCAGGDSCDGDGSCGNGQSDSSGCGH